MGFKAFFSTFTRTVAQTWFVLHETCHTTVFGIYYVVKVDRIENHSHVPDITC